MLSKKQLIARIASGVKAEDAENLKRTNEIRAELLPTVLLTQDALKKAGIDYAGWWNNDRGNGCGLAYNLRMSSVIPGTDVEICTRKSPTCGIIFTDVKRETGSTKIERSFQLIYPMAGERPNDVEDFQLYVALMISERFPDSKFSAIVFDYRGNRRVT